MIRLLALDDLPDGIPAFQESLPDLAAQPLVLRDRSQGCQDWLRVHEMVVPLHATEPANGVLVTPAGLERCQNGITERAFVAPDRQSALLEWSASDAAHVELDWHHRDNADLALLFSAAVEATVLHSELETRITARIELAGNSPVRLLITSQPDRVRELDAQLWARVHAAQTRRRRQEMLRIETGDVELDELWEWWTFLHAIGDRSADRQLAEQLRRFLRIEPDPEKGRVVLHPRATRSTTPFIAHNIRVGDALVRLAFERFAEGCRFIAEQAAGAYPLRLVLQPLLDREPKHCFVDGKPAVLDVRKEAEGVVVPVQIMLDERRVVAFSWH